MLSQTHNTYFNQQYIINTAWHNRYCLTSELASSWKKNRFPAQQQQDGRFEHQQSACTKLKSTGNATGKYFPKAVLPLVMTLIFKVLLTINLENEK